MSQIQELKKQLKKNAGLVIVGTASTWKDAPYDNPELDFWGLNGLHGFTDHAKVTDKFSLWFQLHNHKVVLNQKEHLTWLQNSKVPILMQEAFPEIPKSIEYPRGEIESKYRHYYESSFAWMITLGMEFGYKEIYLYGVHVSSESEYAYQKPNTEYLLGLAEGRGIKIHVPNEADILKSRVVYGFEDKAGLRQKFKHESKNLNGQLENLKTQKEQINLAIAKFKGAIERDEYWQRLMT